MRQPEPNSPVSQDTETNSPPPHRRSAWEEEPPRRSSPCRRREETSQNNDTKPSKDTTLLSRQQRFLNRSPQTEGTPSARQKLAKFLCCITTRPERSSRLSPLDLNPKPVESEGSRTRRRNSIGNEGHAGLPQRRNGQEWERRRSQEWRKGGQEQRLV